VRVLQVNTFETRGGAARAALGLHIGLRRRNVESLMLVRERLGDLDGVVEGNERFKTLEKWSCRLAEAVPLRAYPRRERATWSLQWLPNSTGTAIARLNPDVIHFHWVSGGFVPTRTIANSQRPVVWTLHDMAPLTGGCHFDFGCERYRQGCGRCPQLGSSSEWDLSRLVLAHRKYCFSRADTTLVAPSRWLARCARESAIFGTSRVETIPYGVDTNLFTPTSRAEARKALGLPQGQRLILFLAAGGRRDSRKGFTVLLEALGRMVADGSFNDAALVLAGDAAGVAPPESPMPVHSLGTITEDSVLRQVYAAVDVVAVPSLSDNLPNVVLEAFACGRPCVAFRIGGLMDLIDHQGNGYLADAVTPESFAHGLSWVLELETRAASLATNARLKALSDLTLDLQASRYLALYDELLSPHTRQAAR
jgi:glycosyltransferase involved in cell wall biosynthesis